MVSHCDSQDLHVESIMCTSHRASKSMIEGNQCHMNNFSLLISSDVAKPSQAETRKVALVWLGGTCTLVSCSPKACIKTALSIGRTSLEEIRFVDELPFSI